jgi:DNA-binding NtrC family response regulator
MERTATTVITEVETGAGLVTVVAGPDARVEHAFTEPRLTIGKGAGVGLRLSDVSVSRLHCELERGPDGVVVRDLGSKNGTWIAGCRITEALVPSGMRVGVGESMIEIRIVSRRVRKAVWTGGDRLGPILGASPRMHELFARIERAATATGPALVRGESGTGKELVARALHDGSRRAEGPFVVVDAGAISRTLADVELFGHVAGAFTDARGARPGAFERAHGGTLFLDEVGELPLDLQPKLLRALEDHTVQRLGEGVRRPVDVRLVAATHRNLAAMVAEGSFREDLYYRLAVLELEVPPLRERREDVPRLARMFAEEAAPGDVRALAEVERALAAASGHRWPGNVRELRSFVRRVVILGQAGVGAEARGRDEEELAIRADLTYAEAKAHLLERFERRYLDRVLGETGGNVTAAAKRADLSRSRLYELLTQHGLKGR